MKRTYHTLSSRRRWLTAVLSQHRAYRSVHGAFNSWRARTDRLWLNHRSRCLSVFLLLTLCWPHPFPIHTSVSFGCLPPDVQNIRVFQVSLDFSSWSLVSSTASIYTYEFCDIAMSLNHLSASSYLQSHNNSASLAWRLLSFPMRDECSEQTFGN